jgi:hypothetical protein
MRVFVLAVVGYLLLAPVQPKAVAESTDRLGEALSLVGLEREDLGYRPKGYWSRYPNPDQMAHKLPFFDDLLAEPLRLYDFTHTRAMAAADHLSPAGLADSDQALYRLAYYLGLDSKVTGFRPYSANLHPQVSDHDPLVRAVERIYDVVDRELVSAAFGNAFDSRLADLRAQAEAIPLQLQLPLAALTLNVLDAYSWHQKAFRHCELADMRTVFQIRDLARFMDEGRAYYFEIDDLARSLDERSLYYACMKTVQAADNARRAFAAVIADGSVDLQGISLDLQTPLGRMVLAGNDDDMHAYTDAAILVDLGGNDRYTGPVGGSASLDVPISIAIDCGGDDTYAYHGTAPSQGAGVLGAGVLVDNGGNDTYRATSYAQGLGVFGLGMLFDREGDDDYTLEMSGQGAGYFGLGYHLDGSGNDSLYLFGDGQGFGGPGGVGVLANYSGDDHYVAEALSEKAGRPDYHSGGKISYSNAQGMGAGRRGDGSDGHNWAGGLGVLIDLKGNDRYEAGNFAIGTGYMYGTGLLYDGDGDDEYRSVYFSQASGAHFCIGALIDEAGDDRHELYDTGGAGLGFGWDFTVALLLDRAGNDSYQARGNSLGRADIRSNAFLVDLAGDDEYAYPSQQQGLGVAPFREEYRAPGYSRGPYTYYANSFALLLDTGGQDRYLDLDLETGEKTPATSFGNNRTWQQPPPDSADYGHRSFGVGMDVGDGTIPEFLRPDY